MTRAVPEGAPPSPEAVPRADAVRETEADAVRETGQDAVPGAGAGAGAEPGGGGAVRPEDVRRHVKALLAERLRVPPRALDEEVSLEHLGLDSLLLAEAVAALEGRFGIGLDMELLAEHMAPALPLRALLDELSGMVGGADGPTVSTRDTRRERPSWTSPPR
ncbi:acyl carrier protein [Streptomyces sp. URMC 123]|uniref:acyl carrier protein n=1 Tax=Streptomyces sp. URMC 123 TaxID=3423403 RepID=UPI003F1D7180